MDKKVCVILPWSINNDSRAQRTIREMVKFMHVDVYYIPKNELDTVQNQDNLNIRYILIDRPSKFGLKEKIIQNSTFYYYYDFILSRVLQEKVNYDLVYVHDLPSLNVGVKLKQAFKAKLIYDVHDLYIETLNQQFPQVNGKYRFKHKILLETMTFLGRRFERKMLKDVDLTYTVNDVCKKYLREKYGVKEIEVFRNFPEYRELPQPNGFIRKSLRLDAGKKIVIYHGNMGRGRHLETITKAAKYLPSNIVLVIIGNGALKQDLIKLSKDDNSYNSSIYFMDSVKYEKLFESISDAHLGLMLLEPINLSKEYAIANKITEYFSCAIPALLSAHPGNISIAEESNACYLIDKISPEDIAQNIKNIFAHPEVLNEKKDIARRAFENSYNWSIENSKFIKPFKKLMKF